MSRIILKLIFIAIAILLYGCTQTKKQPNFYSEFPDTIELQGTKKFGLNIEKVQNIVTIEYIERRDSTTNFDLGNYKNENNLKVFSIIIDYPTETLLKDAIDNKDQEPGLNKMSFEDNLVGILTFKRDSILHYVLDQNNNKSFKDDTARTISSDAWYLPEKTIDANFKLLNHGEIQNLTTKINIGSFDGERLHYFVNHYTEYYFKVGDNDFRLELYNNFKFAYHEAFLYENSESSPFLSSEFVYLNDYIKLSDLYFRFDYYDINGLSVRLVKEQNYRDLEGVNPGMIAPTFSCTTTNGEQLSNSDFNARPYIIANVSMCNMANYNALNAMRKTLKDSVDFIIVEDESFPSNMEGKLVIANDSANTQFKSIFREIPTTYICYFVNSNNRMIARFKIIEWDQVINRGRN